MSIPASIGAEFGGNGTTVVSDMSLKAFGMGAGYQASIFGTFFSQSPISGKFRYESIRLREIALSKAETSFFKENTQLKSLSQNWNLLSLGLEGHFETHGQNWFWETMLGYSFGLVGQVTVTQATADQPLYDFDQLNASRFFLGGGFGIRKSVSKRLIGLMSFRTFFLGGSIYQTDILENKTLVLVPVLFNIGIEWPF